MALSLPILPGITWPRGISWGNFDTTIQKSVSGKIAGVYANIISPTRRYNLSISGLDSSGNNPYLQNNSLQTLVGFFHKCYGRALPFQYVDPEDNIVAAQAFGAGDGVTTAFQLTRASGGFVEQVFAPTGAPQIYVAGVLKATPADYSISTIGLVTFTGAPINGAALSWSGNYSWWCHWDTDSLDTNEFFSNYHEAQRLSFTTRIF